MADGNRATRSVARIAGLVVCGTLLLQGCAGSSGESRPSESGRIGAPEGDETLYMALAEMAKASEDQNRYGKAVEQYRRLVEAVPDEPSFVLGLARNTRYAGRPLEAVRILRRAMDSVLQLF